VLAIYAKENGQGMMFTPEDGSNPPTDPNAGGAEGSDIRKSHLKLVK